MKVLALVGKAGAGKDTVSQILEDQFPAVRMGEVPVQETRLRGLEVTDRNVGAVATDLRRKEGMDAIARRCVKRIREMDSEVVVVNGIRGSAEVELFRREFPDFHLIEVWAPGKLRYRRIIGRGRADDIDSYQDFLDRDQREESWGLDEAISMAESMIINDGSLEELEERTWEVVENIEGISPRS